MPTTADKGWHDMGGEAAGPVELAEHDYALWEKRVDALMVLCTGRGLFTVDGLRRAIEDLGPAAFESMSYYERWIAAINRNLIEAGAYEPAELAAKIAGVKARGGDYGACSLGAGHE
ncbi:MAG TPA: ScnB-like protein [Paracoccaceae bacterium]|nr:ScnB-like protein [Paracoccaceae bacterium]